MLDAGQLPVERGYALSAEDRVRRHVITELMCNVHLDMRDVERRFGISFPQYFAAELAEMRRLAEEGLVELSPEWIVVTPKGRLLVRVICMAFDRYLRERQTRAAYSRVI